MDHKIIIEYFLKDHFAYEETDPYGKKTGEWRISTSGGSTGGFLCGYMSEYVIDLDILLYDQQVINTEQLIVPHKELVNRCFVTLPLLDINPTLTLPNGVKVSSLACATLSDDMYVLADNCHWY